MLDDCGDVERVIFVEEVDQWWVDSRWGSESVRHDDDVQGSSSASAWRGWSVERNLVLCYPYI